jgi:hypothetical protein
MRQPLELEPVEMEGRPILLQNRLGFVVERMVLSPNREPTVGKKARRPSLC